MNKVVPCDKDNIPIVIFVYKVKPEDELNIKPNIYASKYGVIPFFFL